MLILLLAFAGRGMGESDTQRHPILVTLAETTNRIRNHGQD